MIDPVRPAADGQAFGAVQQQAAAAMQLTVEVAPFHVDVTQAAAEQVGAFAEGESMGVAFRECLVGEALPATPTSIARP